MGCSLRCNSGDGESSFLLTLRCDSDARNFFYVSFLDASDMINGIFCAGVHVDLRIETDAFDLTGEVSTPIFSPVTGSGDRRGSESS
jgi:hypothetical protein